MDLHSRLLPIIDDIYACSIDFNLWEGTLKNIGDLVGVNHRNLVIERLHNRDLSHATTTAFSKEELDKYNKEYIQFDNITSRLSQIPRGKVLDSTTIFTQRQLEALPIYEAFYKRAKMDKYLAVKLYEDNDSLAHFSLARDFNSKDFNTQDAQVIQKLVPHIQRSLIISNELMQKDTIINGYESGFSELSTASVLIDDRGQIIEHTENARPFLAKRTDIQYTYPLTLPTANATKALHTEIRVALSKTNLNEHRFIPFTIGNVNFKAAAFPWRPSYNHEHSLSHNVACVVLFLKDKPLKQSSIQTALGISKGEGRIAEQIGLGYTVKEISERLFTTESNVRFHIKNILRKTGCKNQTQLVLLIHNHLSLTIF
ncbi:helix-turn-helix transcriptional regulator [Vibrio barjaei]|uniref:helix-turn-helix transcriptional regulator n=1 Tax=Vibrio barjaei TaxID=1676683 RepID=UPI002284173F|nr:helix-turn-helix transcriptional regulator [Vibrio barjaei]MCY9873862.1 helix-turn-helix transcriptional regulator [Vibrio barjaei]